MPYTINGQNVALTEEPHQHDGATFIPFREVVQALGGTVTWDNSEKEASATIGKWTARFDMGSGSADVNGINVQFSTPSHVHDGKLYVPVDFFHNAFGYKTQANGDNVSISL